MSRHKLELPFSAEAEISVLGALLSGDPSTPAVVFDRLSPGDFYDANRRRVFVAAAELYRRGERIDPITVGEELKAQGEYDQVGGYAAIADLLDAVVTAANVEYHVRIVLDRAIRRRLWEAGRQTADDALNQDTTDVETLLDQAERRILQVAQGRTVDGPQRIQEVLWDAMAIVESGGVPGVPSGLAAVDELTGGFKPGNLVIVAGATSMGKSAFALQCAAHAAIEKRIPTAIFSIEMTRVENTLRLFALEGGLDLHSMLNGRLPAHDLPALQNAATRVNHAPIVLDDTATRVMEIRSRARRIKAEHGLGLIVVDHIHDMTAEGESRREQIGEIGRGLKQLAKELDVPVIAVSQLSRAPTTRSDCRPRLSDLRESGDLEAIANVVILMYRPEYYFGPKKGDQDLRGKAEAIVAKNRNGPTGRAELYFRAHCARFEDLETERRPRAA